MQLPKIFSKTAKASSSTPSVRVPIQVNLVPDIKQQLLDAQRKRNLVITASFIVAAASIGVTLFLVLFTFVGQRVRINLLRGDIDKKYEEFSQIHGVQDLVTIQNQVKLINTNHATKPITSRLFTVVAAVVPSGSTVKFSRIIYDDDTKSITLEGQTPNYADYEKLSKTIEMTELEYMGAEDEFITEKITDRVGLVNAITSGSDSEGKRVVLFNIRFIINENLFANSFHDKNNPAKQVLTIMAPDKGNINVTDSNIGIQNLLVERSPDLDDDNKNQNQEAN